MSSQASSAKVDSSHDESQALRVESTEASTSALVPFASDWAIRQLHSPARRWEIASIVCLAILVHGGIAYGAYVEGKKPRVTKRWTKVEVEMVRPPPPPPKAVVPPPEPPKPPPPPKPVKAPPPKPVAVAKPEPEKSVQEPPPAQDTGSSSPSDPDGELYAGSGGLGTAPPAPPPPAPVVAPPPPPAPVIQAREGANYLKNPRPPYPSRALREGWEGTTLLRVQVNPQGKPGAIQVQTSSGRSVLDDAALEAVKRWTFTPATQGGNPISGWVTVPIVFKLQ